MRVQSWRSAIGVGALAVVLAASAPTAHVEAAQIVNSGRETLVVRTYLADDAEGPMRTAWRTASTILDAAGIDVQWVECRPSAATAVDDACTRPVGWNELIVRVVAGPPERPAVGQNDASTNAATLGFAAVD